MYFCLVTDLISTKQENETKQDWRQSGYFSFVREFNLNRIRINQTQNPIFLKFLVNITRALSETKISRQNI